MRKHALKDGKQRISAGEVQMNKDYAKACTCINSMQTMLIEENRKEKKRIEKNLDRSLCSIFFQKIEYTPVSLFRNYFDPIPVKAVSLFDWLLSEEYKSQVEVLRGEPDKTKRRKIKSSLPCVTPSGIFDKRSNDRLIKHSGYICIDLDFQDNPSIKNWDRLKHSLSNIPGYCFGGLSASGQGMFMIIQIENPDEHMRHFHAIAETLRKRGLIVDKQCKDIARLRGASYDDAPYLNEEAGIFTCTLEPTVYAPKMEVNPDNDVEYWVNKLIAEIETQGVNMAEYYDDWFALGQSIANEFGESGRGYFHIISRQSPKYNPYGCEYQYDKCLKNCSRKSIRTFFWYCKQFGLTCKRQVL